METPVAGPGYLINQLARLFANALYQGVTSYQLSTGQFPVLLRLWDRDGQTQSELCELNRVRQPTMANILKGMERKNLIYKVKNPNDLRQTHIFLTDHAKNLQEIATNIARGINKEAFAGFTNEEKDTFLKSIERMIANLLKINS